MTIYLHAGTPKTGTTALQNFLETNKKLIEEAGYKLPSFVEGPNHRELAGYALDDSNITPLKIEMRLTDSEAIRHFRGSIDEQFSEEIDSTSDYIFTSEYCTAYLHTRPELERLRQLLTSTGQDIKVVIYFREPAEYLASTYSTLIKNGGTHPLRLPNERALKTKYNYFFICRNWSSVFGREAIIPRPFVRSDLSGGTIEKDFLELLGVPNDLIETASFSDKDSNASLDPTVLAFLLAVNAHVPRIIDQKVNPLRDDLGQICERLSGEDKTLVPERIRRALYNALVDDIAKFNERFLAGSYIWPFPPYSTEGKRPIEPLTSEQMAQVFAAVWQEKVQQIRIKKTHTDHDALEPAEESPAPQAKDGAGYFRRLLTKRRM
ncbi:MAG: hypothetical protein AAFY02_07025 [Pseudomonadota bacterium]